MTGHWVSPVRRDRTCPIMSGGLLEVTGRWGRTSGHDPTDTSGRDWNLTGSDRTLGSCVWSWHCAASDHHLTVGIGRSVFEEKGHVASIERSDAWFLCPVALTSA